MEIKYKVIFRANNGEYSNEYFHTYQRAIEFARLKGGIVLSA